MYDLSNNPCETNKYNLNSGHLCSTRRLIHRRGCGRMLGRLQIFFSGTSNPKRRADCLTGSAWVVDGDTIIIAGERVRLHGIDAPELDQTFWCKGKQLACGSMALAALEALTAGVKIRCEVVERDRYGRLIAKCFSPNGIDIGRRMVSAGWALAYRQYSLDYLRAEEEARKARRGMWRGKFTKPWLWRASGTQRPTKNTSSARIPA